MIASPKLSLAASARPRFLAVAVFAAGMTSLAVELLASRLLGNVFGTSNLVWANIIGLILVYLTAGYFIGGRWADRSPNPRTFYSLLAWAAFAACLVPLVAQPVLRLAAQAVANLDAAVMGGSFLSVLVLFAVPVTLLGCVSPFAIRLALTDSRKAGQVSGRMYAISTLGSIVGTVEPTVRFDAQFRRASEVVRARWERIALAYRRGAGLPVITLWRRCDGYYVADGRHRMSVARALGHSDIDAWVKRCSGCVGGAERRCRRAGSPG